MAKVTDCLMTQHDAVHVGLAAFICVVASFTVVDLFHHVRTGPPRMRGTWLPVAGVAGGFGIWATHFVAMMAYDNGLPSGYDLPLTVLSITPAAYLTWLGLRVALEPDRPAAPWVGGSVLGVGVAAMHYLGLAAYVTTGQVRWDPWLTAASLALGIGLATLAVGFAARGGKAVPVLLLVLSVCGMHFVSMGAVTVAYDPLATIPSGALSGAWLGPLAGGAGILVIGLAVTALFLDARERFRRRQSELAQNLANAAVEGILLCDGTTVVLANDSFAALAGVPAAYLAGRDLRDLIPLLPAADGEPRESEMQSASGPPIPVEVILKSLPTSEGVRRAVAVRDLRSRRQAESRILHLAHHDVLTGLPNRASFTAKLEAEIDAARAGGGEVALLLLDLDRFKEVNDTFGHAAGDDLLVAVARGVSSILRDGQMLARLGGDEFAIVLPGLVDRTAAGRVAAEAIEAVRAAASTLPAGGVIGTSIGVALSPSDAGDRAGLVANADLALYQAKGAGRGVHRFYEPAMGEEARDRRQIERDLRLAVARSEFSVVYQPQRSVRTGMVTGFEALLRWHHPTRGDVPPSTFIPIAEESGLIHAIGEWVLRRACEEMVAAPVLRIAVNVSALQVHSARFAGVVADVLRETGMPPQRLELEVTETALMHDTERALATLLKLKEIGVQVTMDDFGTGYSSLSNMRMFPFDKIKIDRSFVRHVHENEKAAAIVRAVLGLGRGLGLPVLAEGVETEAEYRFLDAEACDEVQGYLFGRPAPALAHVAALAREAAPATEPADEARAAA